MQREITGYTHDKLQFKSSSLIDFLMQAVQQGKVGTNVLDYNGLTGTVLGKENTVYECELMISEIFKGEGHIFVL